jgi:hypothetical protein
MALIDKLRQLKARRQLNNAQINADEITRRQRFQEGWGRLKERIIGWNRHLVKEDLLQILEVDTDSDAGGVTVHIDIQDATEGTIRTSLVPTNKPVLGAVGKVDIILRGDAVCHLLYHNDGSWTLYDPSSRHLKESFTAQDIDGILEQNLYLVALK